MKAADSVLADFIRDFKLEVPGAGVCFNADIEFKAVSMFKKFNCEVHIITMSQTQLSVVYLIHKELDEYGIPDTFSFDPDNFFYEKMKVLRIVNYDLLRGKYILEISPLNIKSHKSSIGIK